jgi:hypothetical protein
LTSRFALLVKILKYSISFAYSPALFPREELVIGLANNMRVRRYPALIFEVNDF